MPPAASSAGPEAIELAASAGLILDPWQQAAVIDLLGEDDHGMWAATTGGLVCPRQNGKGSIIEALELAWLFLFDVELIFHSAHLFATAADAYRRIKHLIQDTPDLDRQVARYSEQHGQEGIELRTGQRLRFVARSKSGGRGFPAPVVVLDEAFNLSKQAMAALVPTMAAQANPFLLITSSAPIEDPCSDVLRDFMRRSRSGEVDRRCYTEYAADPTADFDTQLAQANPGLGVRLNPDVINEELELLTTAAFEVERLGIVDLEEASANWVIPAVSWAATCDDASAIDGPQVFALAVSDDRAWSTFAAAGRSSAADAPHAEVIDTRPGTAWVVERAAELQAKWGGRLVVPKSSPAASLVTDLEAAGVNVDEMSTEEQAKGCGQLYDAVTEGLFRHRSQPVLDVALRHAVKRDYGEAWVWAPKQSTVDISPLVALTLALRASLTLTAPVKADFFTI